jgi:hypothetical protein
VSCGALAGREYRDTRGLLNLKLLELLNRLKMSGFLTVSLFDVVVVILTL